MSFQTFVASIGLRAEVSDQKGDVRVDVYDGEKHIMAHVDADETRCFLFVLAVIAQSRGVKVPKNYRI